MINNIFFFSSLLLIQLFGQDTITMSDSQGSLKSNSDSIVVKTELSPTLASSIYREQIDEVKILLSESIISDHTGDTLSAIFNFKLLFESLAQIDEMNDMDEFEVLEYNKILKTAIDYYEKKALTINKIETGLSVALLRDKLDEYIYDQNLEELEFVDETVEIIEGHIPITYNRKVASIIKFFQKQGKGSIQKWLNREDKYKKIILPILEEEKVPPELFYLAMIESGLNANAYSYAHASGVWQFIKSTGKIYGLDVNWYTDERLDFEKSTRAAATYLRDLYAEFDDWYLAFAAYNCGSGRVRKAIRRHDSRDYWDLYTLPKETRNYVPNIMAAIFVAMNPEKYGFTPEPDPDFEFRRIEVNKSVSLEKIGECANLDIKTLRYYNPEIKQGVIPPLKEGESYSFRLPLIANSKFDSLFALVEEEKIDEIVFKTHRVKYGETLSHISKKYNSRIKDIVSLNKIKNPNKIKPKTYLQIPVSGYQDYLKEMNKSNKTEKIYHTVKMGDSLSEIAEMYKTSIKNIKRWNGLRNDVIRIGQKIEIFAKESKVKQYSKKKNNISKKIYYTVKYGDTLGQIAEKYGIGLSKIKRWNNLSNSDKIVVGQKLLIWSPV